MILDDGQRWNLVQADKEALRHVLGLVNSMADELAAYSGKPVHSVIDEHYKIVSRGEKGDQ